MFAGLRRFLLRLFVAFRPNRAEDDLAREMRAHLGLMEDDFRSSGLDADAARLGARRAFGGVERAKELQRDARAFRWIDDARRDVAYACRTLARTPAFAAVAVTTLALGIGATTAVFTLFDAVLLRPLAVDRPEELRVVRQIIEMAGGRLAKESTNVPHRWFLELRPRPEVFSEVMAFAEGRDMLMTANGRERRLTGGGLFVSDNYFDLLGVRPALGRAFVTGAPGASDRVVVLSDACWRREFGGARDVIGTPILINGAAFTIVGIGPSAFWGLTLGQSPDVFLPLETLSEAQPAVMTLADRTNWSVQVVGRLPSGTTDAMAGERLTTVRDFMPPRPAGSFRHLLQVLPLATGLSDVRAQFARPLSLLLGMGSLLLLVACANVATLLGARAASRRPEIVIRTAIGAGKGRLVRQLLTETLVLAAVAGALGAVSGSWATQVLLGLLPHEGGPLQIDVAMDRRVLLFTLAISLLTAVVAGVVPALRSLGFDLAAALRDRSRGGVSAGRGRPFAVIQVALSVILVIASTMFARTVYNLTTVDLGFDPDHLIQVFVAPGERQYQGPQIDRYYRGVFDRLRAIPGVRAVTSSQMPLLEQGKTTGTFEVSGFVPRTDEEREAQVFQVGPAFFGTTGMSIVRGRDFTDQDMAGAQKVAAINDVAARRFFGTRDPIGQTVTGDGAFEIVAVIRSAKYNSLREDEPPVVFVPYSSVRTRPRMTFLVRTDATSEAAVIRLVGAAARGEDPLIPLDVTPMRMFVGRSMAQERLLAALSIVFASAALLLLSIGLYGIMTFWVTERTPEIGIHLALGARLSQVRWVVIRQPLWLACIGIAVGLPAALAGSRAVDSLMFGVGPRDPITIAGAVLLVLVVTVVACIPPARRAARVDPMTALRCE